MRTLGRLGGRRSAELRQKRRRTLEEVIADQVAAEADPIIRQIRAAIDRGDSDAAHRAVARAFGRSEDSALHDAARVSMLDRRAESMRTGSRWRDTENEGYDEW